MNYDSSSNKDLVDIFSGYTVFIAVFTIFPAVLVAKRLFVKGTSDDLRKKVLKRHIIYIVLYMGVLWSIFFDLFEWSNSYTAYLGSTGYYIVSFLFFELIGVPIAIIRISEPFVYQEFKAMIQKFFCCTKKRAEKKLEFSDESLCSFMNSAANIEFVYLILLGINNFMENLSIEDDG